MAVTVSDIKTFGGSAFASVPDADVQRWLDYAERMLDSTFWGDCYDDAVTFHVLHNVQNFVLTGGAGGAAGEISSVSVGSVSVSYATSGTESASAYGSTAWGRQYLALLRAIKPTPFVI